MVRRDEIILKPFRIVGTCETCSQKAKMDRMRLLLCRLSSDNLRGDGTKWESETKELLLQPLPQTNPHSSGTIDKETIRSFCLHEFMVDFFCPAINQVSIVQGSLSCCFGHMFNLHLDTGKYKKLCLNLTFI